LGGRYPLAEITQLEAGVAATEVHVACGLTVEMKAYNQDTPFVFTKADHDLTLSFEFVEPSKIIDQVASLRRICTNNKLEERETALKDLIESREALITFDWQWLSDHRETRVYEGRCHLIEPLVENPGRLVITDKNAYFQVFYGISRPVETWKLDQIQSIIPH